jgi:hypothetical protein
VGSIRSGVNKMTRKSLLLLSLPLVLLLSACSYSYDFIVANRSAATIEVQYKLKRHIPAAKPSLKPPARITLDEYKKAKYEWRNLSKGQYQFDDLTGTFIVNLGPDELLLLDSVTNYLGDENQFDIASIKITGLNGSINLEGKQAQKQFKVESDTKYVLSYW